MTTTRARLTTAATAVALAALTLTACGSSSSMDDAATSAAAPATAAAASDPTTAASSAPEQDAPSAASQTPDASSAPDMASSPAEAQPGSYITLAEYQDAQDMYAGTDVVLFFNAEWCSTCKEARDTITSDLAAIPAGLTIVTVDYDTETDLKKKYGVTVQHTFVQVDDAGNEMAKWSGSITPEEIAENTV